ncbi:MAG TPA: hypothetical protein PK788_06030 [Gemmatimonadaceae bacterium]|nr:hypothetical protein [Gemmatimonadaceae bacterium]
MLPSIVLCICATWSPVSDGLSAWIFATAFTNSASKMPCIAPIAA